MRVTGVVRMVRPTLARLALAVAIACSLVACNAEADPRTTPSPTAPSSPTPTTSPTTEPTHQPIGPTEPELPAAAKAPGTEGAGAFVRYYIKLLNYASQTGDIRRLRSAANECNGCRRYEELFSKTYSRGGSFTGNLWSPYAVTVVSEGREYVVLTLVKAAGGRYRPHAGAPVRPLRPDRYSLRFALERDRGGWSITSFEGR